MNLETNFPAGNPVDAKGNMTPQWRLFWMALFARTGSELGIDSVAEIEDLQAEASAGSSQSPDMAAVYGLIHMVEAIAAQAMASAASQPDERGESGESASVTHLSQRVAELEGQLEHYRADDALRQRIADLEGKIDAIVAPQIVDTLQMTNGAGYLAAANNLSDVAAPATARTNLGLGTTNAPTFAGVTSTGPVAAVAASTTTYAMTATRNGSSTGQFLGIGGLSVSNSVDSFSQSTNAKLLTFNATTDASNTVPTSGSVGVQWSILGVAKMLLNQSGNLLVGGTMTDDGSGNPLQSGAGFSFKPVTTTTAPSAGGAGALPATPAGYATITIGGTARKIAYY